MEYRNGVRFNDRATQFVGISNQILFFFQNYPHTHTQDVKNGHAISIRNGQRATKFSTRASRRRCGRVQRHDSAAMVYNKFQ